MSRAWDKAKQGAIWLGTAGVLFGAAIGLAAGIAVAVGSTVPLGIGAILLGLVTGVAVGVVEFGIPGFIWGGIIGGVYGAITQDDVAPAPQMTRTVSTPTLAPSRAAELAQSQEQMSTAFRDSVDRSRAAAAAGTQIS